MLAVSEPKLTARLIGRRVAAAALVLWLAGVGCFFGCEMGVVSAAAEEVDGQAAVEKSESCPAFAGGDCCHKAKAERGGEGGPNAGRTPLRTPRTDCCPLKAQSADPARKAGATDAHPAAAGTPLKFTARAHTPARLDAHRPRVPDRGSTHLRCCVFLI
jgi:hypothetical protein